MGSPNTLRNIRLAFTTRYSRLSTATKHGTCSNSVWYSLCSLRVAVRSVEITATCDTVPAPS